MSRIGSPDIKLVQLSQEDLQALASSEPTHALASAPEGALPPPHVAARSLEQLRTGTPPFWCAPFMIVAADSSAILGGCRFKGIPISGSVEIGYGVAVSERGRGVATAAVETLLGLAAANGATQVVAHIVPDNVASAKVVSRLGFSSGHPILDQDGETVVPWSYQIGT